MATHGRDERDRARTAAIGRRIRDLRLEQDLTQEELAERAEVHRAVVGFIERAEREAGVSLIWRMANGLGISMGELLDGIEDEVSPPPRSRRGRR